MPKRASVITMAILALAIASTSAAIGYAKAVHTNAKPSLKIVKFSPPTVDGRHFPAHTRVKLTFSSTTDAVTYKTTDRHGAFRVVFSHVITDPCMGFVIIAHMRNGTAVIVHTPPKPECAPMGTT
ncbi:MAG TPA: hypothetical protein VFA96_10675 [Nocardioides sp.]|nr:hypothetical protein [Nocardioides sp.]